MNKERLDKLNKKNVELRLLILDIAECLRPEDEYLQALVYLLNDNYNHIMKRINIEREKLKKYETK